MPDPSIASATGPRQAGRRSASHGTGSSARKKKSTAKAAAPKKSSTTKTTTAATTPKERPSRVGRDPNGGVAFMVSVHGPYNARALIEVSRDFAEAMFGEAVSTAPSPSGVIDAVRDEIAAVAKLDKEVADSALAASAVALAYEIESPANSATSKSMCARELRETMTRLRELVPPKTRKDGIDELSDRRADRRRAAATPRRKRS